MDKKRERGDNWSQEEKDLLLHIMKHSAAIIENKKTDTDTNKRKYLEWLNVQRKFSEISGTNREVDQLKGAWRRLRMMAKKEGQHKRAVYPSGSGQISPSPIDDDKMIRNISLTDFLIEENMCDSDGYVKSFCEQKAADEVSVVKEIVVADEEVTTNSTPFSFRSDNDAVTQKLRPKRIFLMAKKSVPQKHKTEVKKRKTELNQSIIQANNEVKERRIKLLEEEFSLKIEYQKRELCHQEMKHKLEMKILAMEKKKKALEIQLLKEKNK